MKPVYVVYTHTDMKDIWGMFFSQFKKYVGDVKTYVAINKFSEEIPNTYLQIYYDDSEPYSERWKQILKHVSEEVFIFLHEDMVLYDKPQDNEILKCISYVNQGLANSIKLIHAGNNSKPSSFDSSLVSNEYSILSIQPTIIKKSYFEKLLSFTKNLNIWDFERYVYENRLGYNDYMVYTGKEKKRGIYHYDSYIFPYIATAIVKGKWNISEYFSELIPLIKEHNIDLKVRGSS